MADLLQEQNGSVVLVGAAATGMSQVLRELPVGVCPTLVSMKHQPSEEVVQLQHQLDRVTRQRDQLCRMLFSTFDLHAERGCAATRKDSLLVFPVDIDSFNHSVSALTSAAVDASNISGRLEGAVRHRLGDYPADEPLGIPELEMLQEQILSVAWLAADIESESKRFLEGLVQLSRRVSTTFWIVCGDCYDTEGRLPYDSSSSSNDSS